MKTYFQSPFYNSFSRRGSKALLPKVLLIGLTVTGLSLGLTGCFFGGGNETETVDTAAEPLSVESRLENKQTEVKITVPANWTKADSTLRNSADIYASHAVEELYTSVLSESADVLNQFSLEDNADKYRFLIEEELGSYEGATKTDVTTIQGKPAIQYEIRGQVEGVPVVYLHTTIEGEGRYYQVVGWTTAERYAENKDTLQEIISSFEGA
ncbi:MAG: hypothetical protein AAFQ63_05520 [Cyanobacteria bacterium J06621_11]